MSTKPKQKSSTRAYGKQLLTAVERLVDDCDELIAQVEALKEQEDPKAFRDQADYLEYIASRIIADYTIKSAFAGGVTALPSMLPGPGAVAGVLGGSLADITFMLKHEVEMALCLIHLYGYDIRDERERWLAYVLVGVRTYKVRTKSRNFLVDLLEAQVDALPRYTPRQLSKLALTLLGRVALRQAARNWVRAVPFVGIAVGALANKVLTESVGWWCVDTLERRRATPSEPSPVIEAKLD